MPAVEQFNLMDGQRAERKLLITVAEWDSGTTTDVYTVTTSQPSDWTTNYTDYYTKEGNVYTKIPAGSGAPTWEASTYYKKTSTAVMDREFLGTRTEDSSIEFNPDIETTTDIRGNNYTDLNKTQPQQSFDPFLILGGGKLAAKLHDIMFRNAVTELNQFTMYIITAYIGDSNTGYRAQKQTGCTITYDSLGGDTKVNFPITVYFSNKTTAGIVDSLNDNFTFTPDVEV